MWQVFVFLCFQRICNQKSPGLSSLTRESGNQTQIALFVLLTSLPIILPQKDILSPSSPTRVASSLSSKNKLNYLFCLLPCSSYYRKKTSQKSFSSLSTCCQISLISACFTTPNAYCSIGGEYLHGWQPQYFVDFHLGRLVDNRS